MLRECVNISLEPFREEFRIKNIYGIYLYIDKKNESEIKEVIKGNVDRFRRAISVLLQGSYHNDLYGKENISSKTKNITAFKFKRRRNSNYRIYCNEIMDGLTPNVKKVVMITVYNKKTQKIDKKIKTLLEKIAKYEYDI